MIISICLGLTNIFTPSMGLFFDSKDFSNKDCFSNKEFIIFDWEKRSGLFSIGYSITIDHSDYIYISGSASLNGNPGFITKIKYSEENDLDIIWDQSIACAGHSVIIDESENIFVVGESYNDAYITKLDKNGNSILNITWGGSQREWGANIVIDEQDNIFMVGKTGSIGAGEDDAFIAKFNSTGYLLMNITWGGVLDDQGLDILLDELGNIYSAGRTKSIGLGDNDVFIAKFNSTGHLLMNTTWGGINDEILQDFDCDNSGNIYLTGRTDSFGAGSSDVFILKYNMQDQTIENFTWGGANYDTAFHITVDNDVIYITGATNSFGGENHEIFVTKFNSFNSIDGTLIEGYYNCDMGFSLGFLSSGEIFITGGIHSDPFEESFFIDGEAFIGIIRDPLPKKDSSPLEEFSLIDFLFSPLGLLLIISTSGIIFIIIVLNVNIPLKKKGIKKLNLVTQCLTIFLNTQIIGYLIPNISVTSVLNVFF